MNVTNAESLLINLVVCLGTSTKKKEIVFSGAHKVLEKIVPKNLLNSWRLKVGLAFILLLYPGHCEPR